jgi:catechol 2,3-dioxygenase-like lactoylglutathione lyase family enzyme
VPVTLRLELFPVDLDRTVDFWTRALGFTLERDERTAAHPYVALRRDAVLLGAARRDAVAPDALRRPPTGVEIVLEVDDLDVERARVLGAGVALDDDVTDRPWGLRDLRVLDPDGHYVRLTTR